MGWFDAASVTELERRRKLLVDVEGCGVVLIHTADGPRALANICVHRERELVKGTLLGNRIVCPGHQWAFDLDTGYEQKMCRYQPTYEVRVDGDRILVADEPRAVADADGPAA